MPITAAALSETFLRLAGSPAGGSDLDRYLAMLARVCIDLFAVDEAGVVLADKYKEPVAAVSTSYRIHGLELLQMDLDRGPCLDSLRLGEPVYVDDMNRPKVTRRWPLFVKRAREKGFVSIVALPMRTKSGTVGALNLFGRERVQFEDPDLMAAQSLADFAAMRIDQETALIDVGRRVQQLQHALNSRVVIEQAKGKVAERFDISTREAFVVIRRFARTHQRLLRDVAADVVAGKIRTEELKY